MSTSRKIATTSMTLAPMLLLTLLACADFDEEGALDELGESATEITALATTSVCVTKPDGRVVRLDGAEIVPDSRGFEIDAVVVATGGSMTFGRRQARYGFVERGGKAFTGEGKPAVFVAAGGEVTTQRFGPGADIWAKAGAIVNCSAPTSSVAIHHEPGAILRTCAGANITQVPLTNTFRRCTPTTPAQLRLPTLRFTLGRNGQTLTATNKTTGSYTTPAWKIVVSKMFGTETKVIFSSTSATGFQTQLPANFGSLYPPSTWWREVILTVRNPFGLVESYSLDF